MSAQQAEHFDLIALARCARVKRAQLNLKQYQAAEQIGISKALICRIEQENHAPTIDNLVLILAWIDRRFEDFVKKEVQA